MISVILPAYNASNFIAESINSILNQTYEDFELIIVNDGSKDQTEEIVNSFKDSRIKLVNNDSNMGIVFSLNKAIAISKGKFIARMDSDDIAMEGRLAKQIEYLHNNNLEICGCSIKTFGSMKKTITYPELIEDVRFFSIFGSPLAHPTVLGYANLFKKYFYNNVVAEDYDLWSRMLIDGVRIGSMQDSLLNYRVHPGQITLDKSDIIESSINISKKYIDSYIDDLEIRNQLNDSNCFMSGNYKRKEINSFLKKIMIFAKKNQISNSMKCRAINIIFARASSYNLLTLVSYIKVLKSIDSRVLVNINKRLALLLILSINKNSKLGLLLSRIFKKI
jgi:glycosyltransferase involved in cell wall biosynthesis